jgi:hypothetical protein
MKELVEFDLEGGQVIYAEVDLADSEVGVARATRRSDQVLRSTRESLESAMDVIQPAAEAVMRKIREIPIKPDEVTVEFGVKLSLAAGAIIASTSTEGNFKIAVTWRSDENLEAHSAQLRSSS